MGLLNFMPGESYGMPEQNKMQGLLSNPMLQIGLGILANNNTQNTAQVLGRGALSGMNNLQQQQQYAQQAQYQQMRQKQMEYEIKKQELADERERKRLEAMPRLIQGKSAYTERPKLASLQDGPMPPVFNEQQYNQDLINAGMGDELIKKQFAPPELLIAPNGEVINKNDTSLIGRNFGKPDTPTKPSAIQEYEYAKSQGYPGTFRQYELESKRAGASSTNVTYGAPVSGVDANGNPIFFQPSKNGGAPSVIPGVSPPKVEPKAPTEMQAKAGTYYNQMTSASNELGSLEAEGFDPTQIGTQFETSMAGGLGNVAVSPKAQQARQAQNQWAESFLRVKTGAAATKDEVTMNVKTFFPQVGDSKETITQKARARKQAENDVKLMAAPSFQKNIIPKDEKMPTRDRASILKQYGVK